MDDIFDDMFEPEQALGEIHTDNTKQLSQLVRDLRAVEAEIEDAETLLKSLKRNQKALSHDRIPALMDEMGIERVDVDGVTVSRRMMVSASIPVDRKDEAHAWLRQEGLDDIIKNDVTVSFGKGEDNIAGDLAGRLEQEGFNTSSKSYVHSSTLRAFVKERVTEGKPIDLDMFGAYIANAAIIKRK